MQAQLIVGLEIHVQLATSSKLFCSCKVGYNDPPNSNVCPVCLGLPGSLPVMNRKAYEYSVRTAMALHCEIARFTKWDRKSYYYPDLPKNYQISQYDLPLGSNGYLEYPDPDDSSQTLKVRILRAHLEEDAGKSMHEGLDHSRVDLNRTGTCLLEIVTQPDLRTAQQCRSMAVELQKLVRFIGVSEADMQKGHMRFEPNINLHITDDDGKEYRTPICEIKNLNSFRALERAVAYEQWRQLEQWKQDHSFTLENCGKQNRGWDDARNETVFQREKEDAQDYRYFPEPDLVPVIPDEKWLTQIQADLPELPLAMKQRFVNQYKLSEYDADVLTATRSNAVYFDQAIQAGGSPKRLANLITQHGLKIANERNCNVDELGISPKRAAQLAKMIDDGTVNASAGATIWQKMLTEDAPPAQLAEKYHLIQKSDTGELEKIVDEILSAHPQAVADVKANSKKTKKARGFLMGQVMQKTRGQANPQIVNELLAKKLA